MRALVPVLACLLLGCSTYIAPERILVLVPIAVTQAPEPLAGLRIHVANATAARAGEGETIDYNTLRLRAALQSALVDAGYVVVVDPDAPRDLVASIDADYHYHQAGYAEMITSLRLCTGNHEVFAVSAKLGYDDQGDLDREDMIRLVESLAESEALVAFASAEPEPESQDAIVKMAR
jgi:hypothetical protein